MFCAPPSNAEAIAADVTICKVRDCGHRVAKMKEQDANSMKDQYYRENQWWVSPYNFVPEVRNSFQLPAKVSIHDATLRDGEQTPGVVFSIADKIAIAEKLDEIGVERIEAGMPAVSEQDFEAIKQISKL